MCTAPKPKLPPQAPERAAAKAPDRAAVQIEARRSEEAKRGAGSMALTMAPQALSSRRLAPEQLASMRATSAPRRTDFPSVLG